MKKKVLLFSILFTLLIFISFIIIADSHDVECITEDCKIDKAYTCLLDRIADDTCAGLSSEERIFSFLATGNCEDEVVSDSKYQSDIKYTAQAILGLGGDDDAESWLLSQNATNTGLNWFLQIDTDEAGSIDCSVTFPTGDEILTINEDKTVSGGGNCLTSSDAGLGLGNNYWFAIASGCYNENFDVACGENTFTTSLFYTESGDTTFHISEVTQTTSGGTITEKVDSLCFGTLCNSEADYEGSLWATFILNSLNHDMSPYLPYLVAGLEDNPEFLPEAFLFLLTGEFKDELLGKQTTRGSEAFWQIVQTNSKFYDTALALYALQFDSSQQKTESINWLLDAQLNSGCWGPGSLGDTRNTAFILFSTWPRSGVFLPTPPTDDEDDGGIIECTDDSDCVGNEVCYDGICRAECTDATEDIDCLDNEICDAGICQPISSVPDVNSCEDAGYFCMSGTTCRVQLGGTTLNDYSCPSLIYVCCDKSLETCSEQGGDICISNENCVGGTTTSASDLGSGQECCIGGTCEVPEPELLECEAAGGVCRVSGCFENEQESFESCVFSTDVCCVEKTKEEPTVNYVWIWILLILIVLIVLGIIFRDRLRPFWFKFKSRFGKGIGPGPGTRPDVSPSPMAYRGIPRRILPPQGRLPLRRPPAARQSGELKDVLKKLKDMGR